MTVLVIVIIQFKRHLIFNSLFKCIGLKATKEPGAIELGKINRLYRYTLLRSTHTLKTQIPLWFVFP